VVAALARQTAADFREPPVRAAAVAVAAWAAAAGPEVQAVRVAWNWLKQPFKAPVAVVAVAALMRLRRASAVLTAAAVAAAALMAARAQRAARASLSLCIVRGC
jgi:hypothetical protein